MRAFFLLLIYTLISIGCSLQEDENKLDCYNDYLEKLRKTELYRNIINEANQELPLLRDKDGRSFFNNSAYIDSVLIDSAVFLNKENNKCLLLILQKTSKDLKLDQVQIIQGSLNGRDWQFSFDRLPAVPNTTLTVNKNEENQGTLSNSFDLLSTRGKIFILTAGTVDRKGCEIDSKYWFDE